MSRARIVDQETCIRPPKPVPVVQESVKLECGYRIDLLVEHGVVLELKAIEQIAAIQEAVVLTHLKLAGINVGLLINFHVAILKDGIRRYIWKEKNEFTTEAAEARRVNGEGEKNPYA